MSEPITVQEIRKRKGQKKISMLTAYDYPTALAVDQAEIDIILVGDSLANVVYGQESTKDVTMDQMVAHAQAVTRAARHALVIGDMPYQACHDRSIAQAITAAKRFIDEAGCAAVKVEWFDHAADLVKELVKSGIAVMGHIGLTPQRADELGGYKVQGRDAASARQLIEQADLLQSDGCFSLVLECVPDRLAELITRRLQIPTIGIGAGRFCDGQVLVTHDMLGFFDRFSPKFIKRYMRLSQDMKEAFIRYKDDIETGVFPAIEHCYAMKDEEFEKLKRDLAQSS